ncbi:MULTISPECIES: head-tail connector protein [Paenibacillus]|uniref:Putative phage protein (Predicted DNA packaging) n=1 Tax=Paenibacillus pabuli TaxID=1472 RepID=A0A855Y654_9BACL|nr:MULTISPECIES: head-tail connector protein [Paenibacillus]PWW37394.1 putative phage protein (predicted DNA packaging) [Paenibacillus pabuli]PXW05536.1 putative phage protein (predicted DNA packaging) [Paenibacillus taichungensis]
MVELSLETLKKYLRIDGSEDDEILTLLVDVAKEYLNGAGVLESDKALYRLAIMMHVALNYENRNPAIKIESINFSLQSIILQLKEWGNPIEIPSGEDFPGETEI